MQPPIARQNGQSVWLYKRPLCRRISDFFSSATKTTSLLTLRWYRDPTLKSLCSWIWTSCSNQLAHSVIPCRYPVSSKKALREEQISAQRCCKCMSESPARWWHSRWVCVTLGEIPRWRCTQRGWMLRLRVFQSCLSALADSFLFRERLHLLRPPVFFLSGICEKKTVSRGFERAVTSELTLAQCPRASPSLQRERAFARPLHSTWSESLRCERHDLVGCEWCKLDDSLFFWRLFLADKEELSGTVTDPTHLPSSTWGAHPRHDNGCQRARARMVSAEEPSRSRLNEFPP